MLFSQPVPSYIISGLYTIINWFHLFDAFEKTSGWYCQLVSGLCALFDQISWSVKVVDLQTESMNITREDNMSLPSDTRMASLNDNSEKVIECSKAHSFPCSDNPKDMSPLKLVLPYLGCKDLPAVTHGKDENISVILCDKVNDTKHEFERVKSDSIQDVMHEYCKHESRNIERHLLFCSSGSLLTDWNVTLEQLVNSSSHVSYAPRAVLNLFLCENPLVKCVDCVKQPEHSRLQNELKRMFETAEATLRSNFNSLASRLDAGQARCDALTQELERVRSKYTVVKEELDSLKLQKKQDELERDPVQLRIRNKHLVDHLHQYRKWLQTEHHLKSQNQTIVSQMNAEKDELETTIRHLREDLKEKERIETRLRDRLQNANAQLGNWKLRKKNNNKSYRAHHVLQMEVNSMKERCKILEQDLMNRMEDLNHCEGRLQQAQNELQHAHSQRREAEFHHSQFMALQHENMGLQERLRFVEQQYARIHHYLLDMDEAHVSEENKHKCGEPCQNGQKNGKGRKGGQWQHSRRCRSRRQHMHGRPMYHRHIHGHHCGPHQGGQVFPVHPMAAHTMHNHEYGAPYPHFPHERFHSAPPMGQPVVIPDTGTGSGANDTAPIPEIITAPEYYPSGMRQPMMEITNLPSPRDENKVSHRKENVKEKEKAKKDSKEKKRVKKESGAPSTRDLIASAKGMNTNATKFVPSNKSKSRSVSKSPKTRATDDTSDIGKENMKPSPTPTENFSLPLDLSNMVFDNAESCSSLEGAGPKNLSLNSSSIWGQQQDLDWHVYSDLGLQVVGTPAASPPLDHMEFKLEDEAFIPEFIRDMVDQ